MAGQLDTEFSAFMIMTKGVLGYLHTAKDYRIVICHVLVLVLVHVLVHYHFLVIAKSGRNQGTELMTKSEIT